MLRAEAKGTSLIPLQPFPALLLRSGGERSLVASDLHIGWEAGLAEKGLHIPSQTAKILRRLLQLLRAYKPKRVIFLGDVKHTIAGAELEEWREVPEFLEAVAREVEEVWVVPGNHDGNLEPLLPEGVRALPSTGVVVGDVGLFHGHAWPSPELLGCRGLVMGHVHPVVALRDPMGFQIIRQVWVKVNCDGGRLAGSILRRLGVRGEEVEKVLQGRFGVDLRVEKLLVMPSFNELLGGQVINRRGGWREGFISPVLRSQAINLDEAEIYLLDGTFLGSRRQLTGIG